MGIFGNWFNSQPTAGNDVAAAAGNVAAIISNTNILESRLATAVLAAIPSLTTAGWIEILDNYLGAGEVAYSLSGTLAQKQAAAVAGGDVVLASAGNVNTALVPECVKCAIVHNGFASAVDNDHGEVTEALTLAVKAAMPAA